MHVRLEVRIVLIFLPPLPLPPSPVFFLPPGTFVPFCVSLPVGGAPHQAWRGASRPVWDRPRGGLQRRERRPDPFRHLPLEGIVRPLRVAASRAQHPPPLSALAPLPPPSFAPLGKLVHGASSCGRGVWQWRASAPPAPPALPGRIVEYLLFSPSGVSGCACTARVKCQPPLGRIWHLASFSLPPPLLSSPALPRFTFWIIICLSALRVHSFSLALCSVGFVVAHGPGLGIRLQLYITISWVITP